MPQACNNDLISRHFIIIFRLVFFSTRLARSDWIVQCISLGDNRKIAAADYFFLECYSSLVNAIDYKLF